MYVCIYMYINKYYMYIYIYPRSVSRWSAKNVCAQGFTVAMMEWISIKIPGDLTPQLVLSGSMGGTMEAPWQRPTLMDCRSTIDSLIDIC